MIKSGIPPWWRNPAKEVEQVKIPHKYGEPRKRISSFGMISGLIKKKSSKNKGRKERVNLYFLPCSQSLIF